MGCSTRYGVACFGKCCGDSMRRGTGWDRFEMVMGWDWIRAGNWDWMMNGFQLDGLGDGMGCSMPPHIAWNIPSQLRLHTYSDPIAFPFAPHLTLN